MPSDDPGVFNLLINEEVLETGGNGTTTGPVVVGVGEGTVSETAGSPDTNLANYETTIDCTRNGVPVLSVEGTKVDGAVANGDVVVCTFTNRRYDHAAARGHGDDRAEEGRRPGRRSRGLQPRHRRQRRRDRRQRHDDRPGRGRRRHRNGQRDSRRRRHHALGLPVDHRLHPERPTGSRRCRERRSTWPPQVGTPSSAPSPTAARPRRRPRTRRRSS